MPDPNAPRPSRLLGLRRSLPALSGHERGVLAATCLSSFGSFYTMTVTTFALPQIQRGLGVAEDEIGALFAVLRFGALLSLALGVMADRVGRRRLLIASVLGVALCNLVTAFVQTGAAFALVQLAARAFVAGQILLAGVVVTEELSAENRGFGLGLLFAIGGLGGALTVLVYAFVDHLPFGWRALFVIGGFGLLVVPWLRRRVGETRRFDAHQSATRAEAVDEPLRPEGVRELVTQHRARLLALIGVVLPVSVIGEPGSVFVSKHLQHGLGYTPAQVGLLVAACGVGAPLGNVVAGALSDRFGRRPVTILVSLLMSLAIGVFYNAHELVAVALGFGLLMACLGSLAVLHSALAAELFPTGMRSTAAGVREAVGTVGSSLGLFALTLLHPASGGHAASITWLLVLTPLSPLVLLLMPETASRELEAISPEPATGEGEGEGEGAGGDEDNRSRGRTQPGPRP